MKTGIKKPRLTGVYSACCHGVTSTNSHYRQNFPKVNNLDLFITGEVQIATSHEEKDLVVYNLEVEEDQSYIANGFVVHNCAICWGLDGKVFSVKIPPAAHPNCRCAILPALEDAGNQAPGEGDFSLKLPEYQRQTLGKAGFEAYQSGDLLFTSDLIGYKQTPYGNQPVQRSLKSVLGDDLAKFYRDGNTKRPDLAELESRINQLEREVVLYMKDDKIAFRSLGNADSAYWSPKQRADAPNGGIITHNHPRLPGAPDGGTFSLRDLLVAAEKKSPEIRIVTTDGLGRQIGYSVRAESWPSPFLMIVKYERAMNVIANSMGIADVEAWLKSQSISIQLDFYDKVLKRFVETEFNLGRQMTYAKLT